MYFIINTGNELSLEDIGLFLGKRQGIDLDTVVGREKAERSKHLAFAISKGLVKVRQKDKIQQDKPTEVHVHQHNSSNVLDVNKLKEELKQEIRDQSNQTSEQILKTLQQLSSNLSFVKDNKDKTDQVSDDLDSEILAKIHAKTVDKLLEKVGDKRLEVKEKKSQESVDKAVSDLEGLL